MDDLYREIILDHYKNPRNFGALKHPTCSAHKNNPLCGDELSVDVLVGGGTLEDIKFSGQGCAISIASASMLSEKAIGQQVEVLKRFSKDDILDMLGTNLTPARLKCALLSLEVLQQALQTAA